MNIRTYLLFFLLLCNLVLPKLSIAQINTYQFEELDSLQKKENRSVLVFIYTDWCTYCHAFKNTTLRNDSIIALLNNNFYFVTLNAEQKVNINFNGYTFKYKPRGINTGINELAEQLGTLDGKISYPTICFLNANNDIVFQHNAYINAKELFNILSLLANKNTINPLK